MAKAAAKTAAKKAPKKDGYIDGDVVLKREACAFKLKEPWEPILREIFPLIMAARNPYDPNKTALASSNMQFDSTAPMSLFKATNRIMSELTPVDQSWVQIDIGPVLNRRIDETKRQFIKQRLAAIVEVDEVIFSGGNYVNAQWETFLEMLGGIMGCMLVLEDPDDDTEPVSFQCVSQSEVAIELDGKGKLKGVYRRRHALKVREIEEIWHDATLPKELTDMLNGNGKDENDPEIDISEACYRMPGGKWCYCIYWRKDGKDPVELVSRDYDECPWIIFQWSRMPGSPYGPGPAILMIASIRMVNKVREMIIMNAALALAGMYLGRDDGVLNIDNIQITQGGIIPVGSTGGNAGASLVPLQTGRNFDIAQLVLKNEQDLIRAGLFDNGLPDPSEGVRSPTEILQRVRELAQDVGGAIGRMTRSLVDLVARVNGIAGRRGLVPPITLDQFTFKVQIKSPLARAQQLQEVQTFLQYFQMCLQIGGPQLTMLTVDVEGAMTWIASKLGVSHDLFRQDVDKQQLQQMVATIIAQQAQQPAQVARPALPPQIGAPGSAMPAAA